MCRILFISIIRCPPFLMIMIINTFFIIMTIAIRLIMIIMVSSTIIFNILIISILYQMAENYEEVVRGWGYNMPEVTKIKIM